MLILSMGFLILSCDDNEWVILENKSDFERNFDTPQGAVLCLEDAFRSKDIEKIMRCKDFRLEAIYMLRYDMGSEGEDLMNDEEIIDAQAEVLALAFKGEMQVSIPNFDNAVKSEFPRMKVIDEQFIILEEVCTWSDGGQSRQSIVVGKGDSGWRMMFPK